MTEDVSRRRSLGFNLFKSKARKDSTSSIASSASGASVQSDNASIRNKLRKGSLPLPVRAVPPIPPKGPFLASRKDLEEAENKLRKKRTDNFITVDTSQAYGRNEQTGEQQIDHTDLLHSLVHSESREEARKLAYRLDENGLATPGEAVAYRLPPQIWRRICDNLELADNASLTFTCKAFLNHPKLNSPQLFEELKDPSNKLQRTSFLLRLDEFLPNHIFCYNCIQYHHRLSPGQETLQKTNIANPLFACPFLNNPGKRASRVRITSGRQLPYTYIQLATRANHHGDRYGIPLKTLTKRYKDSTQQHLVDSAAWSHQTRYAFVNGHLLMRVTSTTYAPGGLPPAGLRNLLYNPQDEFHPYFSACPHWRDGLLMPSVKCAISHIPPPITGGGIDRVGQNMKQRFQSTSPIVSLCQDCKPMRRCPLCPTEYLIEIKMAEDKSETDPRKSFKQALTVTRWSDLGDGTMPMPPEVLDGADAEEFAKSSMAEYRLATAKMNGLKSVASAKPAAEATETRSTPTYTEDSMSTPELSPSTTNAISPTSTVSTIYSASDSTVPSTPSDSLTPATTVSTVPTADYPSSKLREVTVPSDETQFSSSPKSPSSASAPESQQDSYKDPYLSYSREWHALTTHHATTYDSFAEMGKRAISGIFEAQFNVDLIPGQRILNLNPEKVNLGERGHEWY